MKLQNSMPGKNFILKQTHDAKTPVSVGLLEVLNELKMFLSLHQSITVD